MIGAMPTKRAQLYPTLDIAKSMERKRVDLGLTVEAASDLAGMKTKWSWYDKAGGRSPFTLEEIGLFAAAVEAPLGWPFIEWSAGKWLEAELAKKK